MSSLILAGDIGATKTILALYDTTGDTSDTSSSERHNNAQGDC